MSFEIVSPWVNLAHTSQSSITHLSRRLTGGWKNIFPTAWLFPLGAIGKLSTWRRFKGDSKKILPQWNCYSLCQLRNHVAIEGKNYQYFVPSLLSIQMILSENSYALVLLLFSVIFFVPWSTTEVSWWKIIAQSPSYISNHLVDVISTEEDS